MCANGYSYFCIVEQIKKNELHNQARKNNEKRLSLGPSMCAKKKYITYPSQKIRVHAYRCGLDIPFVTNMVLLLWRRYPSHL